jgi:hypothetical protein
MSKSEVIIANELYRRGIDYTYEKELRLSEGRTCKPDFTIEDAASGLTVFWEHCGMLDDTEYRERWELKQDWYRENGVLPFPDVGGVNGTLVVTSDDPRSGFDTLEIGKIISKLFGSHSDAVIHFLNRMDVSLNDEPVRLSLLFVPTTRWSMSTRFVSTLPFQNWICSMKSTPPEPPEPSS